MTRRWVLKRWLFLLGGAGGGVGLGAFQQSDLRVIASADADLVTLRRALDRLGPVEEPPEFWLNIISDRRFSPAHRRLCLDSFFKRHAVGARVDSCFALLHRAVSFSDAQVRDATHFSLVPVKRPPGQSVFMLRPELPAGNDSAIYIRLSTTVTTADFLMMMRGNKPRGSGVRILEVGINDVPD
jgi:hypothetical protein